MMWFLDLCLPILRFGLVTCQFGSVLLLAPYTENFVEILSLIPHWSKREIRSPFWLPFSDWNREPQGQYNRPSLFVSTFLICWTSLNLHICTLLHVTKWRNKNKQTNELGRVWVDLEMLQPPLDGRWVPVQGQMTHGWSFMDLLGWCYLPFLQKRVWIFFHD